VKYQKTYPKNAKTDQVISPITFNTNQLLRNISLVKYTITSGDIIGREQKTAATG
jgi:hypothetical protein